MFFSSLKTPIKEGLNLKGLITIFFFSLFTVASLLIPVPMFPSSWLSLMLGQGLNSLFVLLSALFNGLVYGGILGVLFYALSRKIEQ